MSRGLRSLDQVGAATRAKNPQLFATPVAAAPAVKSVAIRQRQGDGLNKTERRFLDLLLTHYPPDEVHPHGLTFALANGVKYTPDFFVEKPVPMAFEVKGPRAEDDSIVKLKVAPRSHKWLGWYLATEPNGPGNGLKIVRVLP